MLIPWTECNVWLCKEEIKSMCCTRMYLNSCTSQKKIALNVNITECVFECGFCAICLCVRTQNIEVISFLLLQILNNSLKMFQLINHTLRYNQQHLNKMRILQLIGLYPRLYLQRLQGIIDFIVEESPWSALENNYEFTI